MEADDEAMESDETSAPKVAAAAWEPEPIRTPDVQFEHYKAGHTIVPTFEKSC